MICDDIQPKLGELLDGELSEPSRQTVQRHLDACPDCRAAYESLRDLALALSAREDAPRAPREALWHAIEQRLAAAAAPLGETAPRTIRSFLWRPLASAAVVLLTVGLGWLFLNAPWSAPAYAGRIDFRPLLEQAEGDIQAGIDALLKLHGGRAITRAEASKQMKVRIASPERLPPGLTLRSMYLLNLGRDHQALGFHYQGPKGHLLLLQCPPGVQKNYGGQECLPCRLGSSTGEIARAGTLSLAHYQSENVCVCVVSTLDEATELPAALDAVKIDF